MTHTEMLTQLRTLLGEPTTSDVPDAQLTLRLNQAYLRICDTHNLPQLLARTAFNTVVGTQSYALAATDLWLLSVWNKTHGYKLRKIDFNMLNVYDDSSSTSPATGRPKRYYRDVSTVTIYPKPDAIYAMEFVTKIKPTKLTASGDTPILSEPWHEGICLLARWYWFDQHFDYPKAQYAYSVWQTWLQTKPNEAHQESVDLNEAAEFMPNSGGSQVRDFDYQ